MTLKKKLKKVKEPRYLLDFKEIDRSKSNACLGGKGANLGELSGIKGIRVPERFLRYRRGVQKNNRK